MKLRTQIHIAPFDHKIDYQSEIFTIGSCFAQNIGAEMERAKFRVVVNPTGTLFNPMSVCSAITRLCCCQLITADELRQNDLGWYHFDFHSSLSAPTKEETLLRINRAIELGHEAITKADWVVITLGTAWVYRLVESERLVANCHKLPARNFNRTKLSVDDVVNLLRGVIERELRGKNVVLTVSPIRHVADGLIENSLSKATLRLAIDRLEYECENVSYFPAYEIMVDDLRDYRFYGQDMVHPSPLAVEYIWTLFCDAALSSRAKELLPRVEKIMRAVEHRPINPMSEAHKSHVMAQLRAIKELNEVDFIEESEYFSSQLEKKS